MYDETIELCVSVCRGWVGRCVHACIRSQIPKLLSQFQLAPQQSYMLYWENIEAERVCVCERVKEEGEEVRKRRPKPLNQIDLEI